MCSIIARIKELANLVLEMAIRHVLGQAAHGALPGMKEHFVLQMDVPEDVVLEVPQLHEQPAIAGAVPGRWRVVVGQRADAAQRRSHPAVLFADAGEFAPQELGVRCLRHRLAKERLLLLIEVQVEQLAELDELGLQLAQTRLVIAMHARHLGYERHQEGQRVAQEGGVARDDEGHQLGRGERPRILRRRWKHCRFLQCGLHLPRIEAAFRARLGERHATAAAEVEVTILEYGGALRVIENDPGDCRCQVHATSPFHAPCHSRRPAILPRSSPPVLHDCSKVERKGRSGAQTSLGRANGTRN